MMLTAGMDLPLTTIREQIASAVDFIVQITSFSCGSRKVASICEVTDTETAPSSSNTSSHIAGRATYGTRCRN